MSFHWNSRSSWTGFKSQSWIGTYQVSGLCQICATLVWVLLMKFNFSEIWRSGDIKPVWSGQTWNAWMLLTFVQPVCHAVVDSVVLSGRCQPVRRRRRFCDVTDVEEVVVGGRDQGVTNGWPDDPLESVWQVCTESKVRLGPGEVTKYLFIISS